MKQRFTIVGKDGRYFLWKDERDGDLYDILDCLGGTLDNVVYARTGE